MVDSCDQLHKLSDKWVFWAHLPHDIDWSMKSYHKLITVSSLEEVINIANIVPEEMICNCMIFVMRDGINPLWEDENNKKGGSFSFKVDNDKIHDLWKDMVYLLVGEYVLNNENDMKKVNGITISPKKNFSIMKIWLRDCTIQNPKLIHILPQLDINGVLFKKHNPQY